MGASAASVRRAMFIARDARVGALRPVRRAKSFLVPPSTWPTGCRATTVSVNVYKHLLLTEGCEKLR